MKNTFKPVEGFETFEFYDDDDYMIPVYKAGEGPGVLVMHEIPGPTPELWRFARKVVDAGFTVYVPVLFGKVMKKLNPGYVLNELRRACISKEFHVLASRGSSPITHRLRALCRYIHKECGGPGVGAIGMCLTGNFALSLMVDESVMAPVLSQPSLPFAITKDRRSGLHLSDEDLATVKQRVSNGACVLGMRFTHDPAVPPERFKRLKRELGDGFEAIEIDSGPGNPHNIKRIAHSVVTMDFVDEEGHPTREALDRVISFYRERLYT